LPKNSPSSNRFHSISLQQQPSSISAKTTPKVQCFVPNFNSPLIVSWSPRTHTGGGHLGSETNSGMPSSRVTWTARIVSDHMQPGVFHTLFCNSAPNLLAFHCPKRSKHVRVIRTGRTMDFRTGEEKLNASEQ
jgi:hypothetical protein